MRLCCYQFYNAPISKNNLFDMVIIADLENDYKLFKKISNFVAFKLQMFPEIPGWRQFIQNNPQCASKILNLIMFKTDISN